MIVDNDTQIVCVTHCVMQLCRKLAIQCIHMAVEYKVGGHLGV